MNITRDQVLAFRTERHHLERRAPAKDLLRVVERLVGVQSQVASAAVRSIAARVTGVDTARIDAALHEARTLARTWAMRCTLHVVTRADYPLVAAALGVDVGGFKRWLVRCGLTEERYVELRAAVLAALADGALSRAELEARVRDRLHGTSNLFGSWGGIMKLLALEGRVVIGPRRAQETTFVRADRWFGAAVALPAREAALAALLRRYLALYGPATLGDFSYWAGVPAGLVKAAFQAIQDEVIEVIVEGRPLLALRKDRRALESAEPTATVRLLPHFDTYLLGHREKSLFLDPEHRKKVFRTAGWVSPVVLEGGRVVGTWELRSGALELAPFRRFARSVARAAREEAARFAP